MGAGTKEVATIEALPDKVTSLNGQKKHYQEGNFLNEPLQYAIWLLQLRAT